MCIEMAVIGLWGRRVRVVMRNGLVGLLAFGGWIELTRVERYNTSNWGYS